MKKFMMLLVILSLISWATAAQPLSRESKVTKDSVQNLVFTNIDIIGTVDNPQGLYVLGGTGEGTIVLKIQRPPRTEVDNVDRESFEEMTEYSRRSSLVE